MFFLSASTTTPHHTPWCLRCLRSLLLLLFVVCPFSVSTTCILFHNLNIFIYLKSLHLHHHHGFLLLLSGAPCSILLLPSYYRCPPFIGCTGFTGSEGAHTLIVEKEPGKSNSSITGRRNRRMRKRGEVARGSHRSLLSNFVNQLLSSAAAAVVVERVESGGGWRGLLLWATQCTTRRRLCIEADARRRRDADDDDRE